MSAWWENAAIYQIYLRSFQDSDGDGIGDLPGIVSRLDHLVDLGVDALWLSPIHPSPLADFGYDVADYTAVDPVFGTLDDFDRLVAAADARGLRVLMDLVPCHTSIEHAWFREHRDWYIWADGRDGGPPNNWRSTFGGPAWSRDPDGGPRWYMHSFYPQQPDLDWRNPEVVAAMGDVVRFWLDRRVAGFRVDAIDRLIKDSELRDDPPASAPFALPLPEEYAELEHLYSRNQPEIRAALASLRAAAGDALLVGEVYLPAARVTPYLESLDAAFAFELFHAPWDADALQAAIEAELALPGTPAWALSNHDFPRLPDRYGEDAVRDAARLVCSLPGLVFIYQGDEIGMRDGPGADLPFDRAGRDPHRHPMQWNATSTGGFTTGTPWLAPVDPAERNVAAQREDPDSLLSLYRDLLAWRRDTVRASAEG
ncbi:MAG TPA: alpha-amylase family glycosyl hydrolase [Thermoleophilaceae bacterium]|nr:alpha-amylase family glycosyl hydrolase [Thermoleophilaceae bacterium]